MAFGVSLSLAFDVFGAIISAFFQLLCFSYMTLPAGIGESYPKKANSSESNTKQKPNLNKTKRKATKDFERECFFFFHFISIWSPDNIKRCAKYFLVHGEEHRLVALTNLQLDYHYFQSRFYLWSVIVSMTLFSVDEPGYTVIYNHIHHIEGHVQTEEVEKK